MVLGIFSLEFKVTVYNRGNVTGSTYSYHKQYPTVTACAVSKVYGFRVHFLGLKVQALSRRVRVYG